MVKENPLVTVVIPTYNRANLIVRATDSVIKQTYNNLEIIVVDDASTDNTAEVIKAIKDPRIRYIVYEKNGGSDKARNTGIEAATGEYIAFLDSDDVWLPNKIELQVATIQNASDPEKAVIYTQVKNDKGYEVTIQPNRAKKDTESLADYMFVYNGFIQTSTIMLSRQLAMSVPFRSGISPHEDLDVFLRLEEAGGKYIFIQEPLSIWHNDMRSNRLTKMRDYRRSLNWIMQYESSLSPKAIKGFLVTEVVSVLIASEREKLYAQKILLDALLLRAISPQKFAKLTARIIIPESLRQKLKNIRSNNK
ncbi:glycosyltransferase family 2 protein [Argonema antarcticum A004/B2]|nr:glycosyltransferase family 2 protein [Argonema antarcticum A004/B2]